MHTITVRLKGSDLLYTPEQLVVIEVGDFDPSKHEMLNGSPMPNHVKPEVRAAVEPWVATDTNDQAEDENDE